MTKTYYYAAAQPLAQVDYTDPDGDNQVDDIYFYLHDRLGSVRLFIDDTAAVMSRYTYDPFGEMLQQSHAAAAPTNAFLYTGQWYDTEIGQYCLRARMYDPALMRFTTRDPHQGDFVEPMTLHRYLYCLNDPINRLDINGMFSIPNILTRMGIGSMLGALTNGTVDAIKGENVGRAVLKGGVVGAIGSLTSIGLTAKFIGTVNPSLLQAVFLNAGVEASKTGAGMIFDMFANIFTDDPQNIEFSLAEFSTNVLIGSVMDFGVPRLQDMKVAGKLKGLGDAWDGWVGGNYNCSQEAMEMIAEEYGKDVSDIILINKAITHIIGSSTSLIDW